MEESKFTWLYPTDFHELEKSFLVKKFGRTLFFPKSIVKDREVYKYDNGTKGSKNHYQTERCKFYMPNWYVEKYDILHWDEKHMRSGETFKEAAERKFNKE